MQQVYAPYGQYKLQKNQLIQDADRVTLITMLLEGAISYNKKAILCLDQKNKKQALENIDYAIRVVIHLYSSLNFEEGGEIAESLGKLYHYICDCYAQFQRDLSKTNLINSINSVLNTILDGWKQLPNDLK